MRQETVSALWNTNSTRSKERFLKAGWFPGTAVAGTGGAWCRMERGRPGRTGTGHEGRAEFARIRQAPVAPGCDEVAGAGPRREKRGLCEAGAGGRLGPFATLDCSLGAIHQRFGSRLELVQALGDFFPVRKQ